jgi:hypothetical protein
MARIPVNSSNLRSVGYDSGTLEIEFRSGGIYQYFSVPQAVYRGLMAAGSLGSYFASYIKHQYRYMRIR